MFYEELSDFYYDPKARLYYGAKHNAYFRYDDSQDPPFVETQRVDPAQGTPLEPVAPSLLLPPSVGVPSDKPKIVINLKTKKMKTPQPSASTDATSNFPILLTQVQKTQVAYIEKWQVKQAELKTPSFAPVITSSSEVKRTAKGEPICTVCKRKFPTVEKLRLHESMSELHKTNLALQQQQQQPATQDASAAELEPLPATQPYTNRAEKRRHLHGEYPEAHTVKAVTVDAVVVAPQVDSLGETNVGNQLLQKMGWQAGAELGGRRSGDEQSTKLSSDLRKDWDRIEVMAAKKHGPLG
jgi:hypothetical protein